ncbi:hypothetical protein, partial [Rhizobium leguminosarum]|uniref:hypothetical protein n=1 Tax=Rhizobium leguminosarum TaxID=384 RepID=UPI003F9C6F2A
PKTDRQVWQNGFLGRGIGFSDFGILDFLISLFSKSLINFSTFLYSQINSWSSHLLVTISQSQIPKSQNQKS